MTDTPEVAASYAACARVAARKARNFYPSFLLLPADRRRSMCALYAFMRRPDDIADAGGPPADRREALARWRVDLDRALRGDLPDAWDGWPALADAVDRHGIPGRYLHE